MKDCCDLADIEKKVRKMMDSRRFEHTVGVRYTAAAMAMAFGEDINRAQTAALLHDAAKQLDDDEKLKRCRKYGISVTPFEEAHPFLLHARLGAAVAERKFGITDPEILSAIRWHTTGKPGMSVLEMIIFIADYIEPGRNKAADLPRCRREAFRDLEECCYMILENTLNYLDTTADAIDETTREAFEYYRERHDSRFGRTSPKPGAEEEETL